MCICLNVHITKKFYVSDDVFMHLLESHPYIYDGELVTSMKFPSNCSSVSSSLHHEFFFRAAKVE